MSNTPDDSERRQLGLDAPITRRDFVNGALASAGSAMLGLSVPPVSRAATDMFTGYGGVGDYAKANGNTWPVVQAAHRLRDGHYDASAFAGAKPAGDFDLIARPTDIEAIQKKWHGSELLRVRQGHFGYRMMRETIARLEERFL